jgi:hypothetical protein
MMHVAETASARGAAKAAANAVRGGTLATRGAIANGDPGSTVLMFRYQTFDCKTRVNGGRVVPAGMPPCGNYE